MNLDEITYVILTRNEEANIARTLDSLAWASHGIVVDSESTDATPQIVGGFPNARLIVRPFDNLANQWNFALDHVNTPWVLTLDADYQCPASLPDELRALAPGENAYLANFRYCVHGRPLRGTLYPPRIVLFRTGMFRHGMDGHAQKLHVDEPVGELSSVLLHDDRKPLDRWLFDQSRYATQEVEKLLATPHSELGWKDRLRKRIFFAAPATLAYCLIAKGLVFDGWPGIYYTLQRVYAELLLSLKLLDSRWNASRQTPSPKIVTPYSPGHESGGNCDHQTGNAEP